MGSINGPNSSSTQTHPQADAHSDQHTPGWSRCQYSYCNNCYPTHQQALAHAHRAATVVKSASSAAKQQEVSCFLLQSHLSHSHHHTPPTRQPSRHTATHTLTPTHFRITGGKRPHIATQRLPDNTPHATASNTTQNSAARGAQATARDRMAGECTSTHTSSRWQETAAGCCCCSIQTGEMGGGSSRGGPGARGAVVVATHRRHRWGGEVGGVQRGGWVVGGAAFRPALSGKDSLTHAHALSLSCGTMGKKAYRPMPTSLLPKCTQCDVLLQRRQGCSAVRMCWPRGALLREGLVVLSTGTVYCVCSVGHIDFEQYHPTKARVAHYAGKLRLCLFHQMRQNPAAGCVERTHRITKYHRMAECESVRQRSHAAHTSSSTNGASDRHTVNRQS